MALTVAANAITFSDQTSLSSGNIQGAQIAPGTITNDRIALGGILSDRIANNAIRAQNLDSVGQGSGNPPIYACRAWVCFNGINFPPTIRSSGNVSSIGRTATGEYVVNFTTPMIDNEYCVCTGVLFTTGSSWIGYEDSRPGTRSISQVFISTANASTNLNSSGVSIAIFR